MGAMKEALMDFEEQIEIAEEADDQVIVNLLHAIIALKTVISRLNLARTHFTSPNTAIRETIDHEIQTMDNDINFLNKIVSILNDDQEAA